MFFYDLGKCRLEHYFVRELTTLCFTTKIVELKKTFNIFLLKFEAFRFD